MTTRIDRLTPAQEAQFQGHAGKWIAAGLRTGTADWDRFELAARECYRLIGVEWPGLVIRVSSPMVGMYAAGVARRIIDQVGDQVGTQVGTQVGAQIRDQIGTQVGAQIGAQVGDQVGAQVRAQIRAQVDAQVDAQVGDQVGDQIDAQVRDQVRDQVDDQVDDQIAAQIRTQIRAQVDAQIRAQVGTQVRDQVGEKPDYGYLGGQFWLGWYWGVAFVDFFRAVCDLELPGDLDARADAYREIAESACWWWPHTDMVIVCDRPNVIHRESTGETGWGSHRLHCATGPAVGWDGWGVYAWHGVRVPADLIEVGWSTDRILAEPNAEVRRAAIEILGWDQFIVDAELVLVDQAVDPGNPGQRLALYDVPAAIYETPVRVLLCANGTVERDGTRRRFGLTTPADMPDAVSAAAWTYGLTGKEYAGLGRRT